MTSRGKGTNSVKGFDFIQKMAPIDVQLPYNIQQAHYTFVVKNGKKREENLEATLLA